MRGSTTLPLAAFRSQLSHAVARRGAGGGGAPRAPPRYYLINSPPLVYSASRYDDIKFLNFSERAATFTYSLILLIELIKIDGRQQRLDVNKQTLKDPSRSRLITACGTQEKSRTEIMNITYRETLVLLIGVHLHTEIK